MLRALAPTLTVFTFIATSVSVLSAVTPVRPAFCPDPTYGMLVPRIAPALKKQELAHWIWLGAVMGDQQVNARTVFTLRAKPRTADAWVTADDAFTLYVNGRQVEASQPVEQGWAHPKRCNVAAYLRAGKNVLAVSGVNTGGGAAGILVELDVNGVQTVISGAH